jgi:TolB-like protein
MDRTSRNRLASLRRPEPRKVIPLRPELADARPALQLCVLGTFGLGPAPRVRRTLPKKAQALLAYLVMQHARPVPREQLAELLWGRSGGEQARRSLRQCLMAVRAALQAGDHTLTTEGDSVALVGPAMAVDATAFETLAKSRSQEDLAAAQALYRGEFLSGLQIASEPFVEWLLVERRRLASAMSEVLYRLAAGRQQAGEIAQAIPVAERLVEIDPLREDGHRLLMQLLTAAGRRDTALTQYARCVDLLRRDLGVAPEPASAALAASIRGGEAPAAQAAAAMTAPARPALALPDKPSIALLPFGNLGGDAGQDYFADGIADDLTIALGRIPWLFVIASSSTTRYRDRAPDVRQIGAELGVRYVLRGSVRRSDRRLRIVVQLTDASDGRHVWSDRHDGDLDDVFAIQDRVTAQVAGSIAPALQVAEIERARRKPPESLTAYELYLSAVPRFRNSLADNRESLRLLGRAIDIDPAYGAAYGFASRCYQFQKLLGWVPPADASLGEGVRLGHLAVDIGRDDSEALWMAGHALSQLAGESERGIALIDRSLVLNPNSANAWVSSCGVRSYVGDARTAIEHFARAERLNPLDASHHVRWNVLGLAYLSAGDFEEVDRAADKALNAAPTYVPALRLKMVACGLLGRVEEGRACVGRLLAVHPGESIAWLQAFWGPPMRRNPNVLANIVEGARRSGLPEGDTA